MLTNRPVCLVPRRHVSPIPLYIILHRAIFVQEVHCIFLCFGVAELLGSGSSHFSRPRPSQESLSAIKESGWGECFKHRFVVSHLSKVSGKQALRWPFNSVTELVLFPLQRFCD